MAFSLCEREMEKNISKGKHTPPFSSFLWPPIPNDIPEDLQSSFAESPGRIWAPRASKGLGYLHVLAPQTLTGNLTSLWAMLLEDSWRYSRRQMLSVKRRRKLSHSSCRLPLALHVHQGAMLEVELSM